MICWFGVWIKRECNERGFFEVFQEKNEKDVIRGLVAGAAEEVCGNRVECSRSLLYMWVVSLNSSELNIMRSYRVGISSSSSSTHNSFIVQTDIT